MSDSVTLASILGSHVSIQWFEAVAVVREVADRLLTSSNDRAIPELQQIRLSPQGHVEIVGVTPTDEPVRRMGQLLQALVAHTDVPVQLRLIITQATAPSPLYGSIRDCSDALGFFERPERSTVLSTLAARVTAAAESTPTDRALTLDSIAPLPTAKKAEEEKKKTPPPDSHSRSRGWVFAAIAVVILAAAGGAAWYAHQRGLGPQNREEASALAERASEAMGTAIVSGASKVTETLGLGRIVPAKEATSPPPAAPPVAAAVKIPLPRRAATDETPQPAPPDPPIIAFDLEPTPARARPPAETPVPAPSTGSAAAGEGVRHEEDAIYSVTSPLIVPPVGIRPKLARQLPPDFDPTRLGRIELIIGVDGLVESAKLLGPPRTVNDGLFLSVAKAWLFQPALRDGMPVRYRKTIWIASP